jgi:hypothetical protein
MFGLNDEDTKKNDNNQKTDDSAAQTPPNPFGDGTAAAPAPVPEPATAPEVASQHALTPDSAPAASPVPDDLMDIKQKALQSLQPLVSHLEQSPEEKFRTTMMLIQATDNSALVKQAYEAANAIPDEKARAQALLDVVNEINYFTHQENGSDSKP